MFILDDILLAPVKGIIWLGKTIGDVVEKELYDEQRIKERLMELQLRLETDDISEREYEKQEADLLSRLDTIRKAKEEEV